MKLCWDILNRVSLSKRGNFVLDGRAALYLKSHCKGCGDPYFAYRNAKGDYCSHSCASSGTHNGFYGAKHTENTLNLLSGLASSRVGNLNPNFKGGYWKLSIPLYDTYVDYLIGVDEIRRSVIDNNVLEVRCLYCGTWFVPIRSAVDNRIKSLFRESVRGECRFYCSSGCKAECPTFGRRKYHKGFKVATSREVQPELRKMVFERDGWTCQHIGCNNTSSNSEIHCHHILPVAQDPLLSADLDNCITLCKKHHKLAHKIAGCNNYEIRCVEV